MYLPGEITRAGKNTKIILLGDPDQIDKPFLDERTNVLTCSECDNEIVIFDKRLIDAGTDEFLSVPAVCLKNKR